MRFLLRTAAWLCVLITLIQAPDAGSQAVSSGSAVPGSSSIDAGDYLYISAQGPRRADGTTTSRFSDQVRQCLDNAKHLVEAAGLTMEHVVYVQVYVEDTSHSQELDDAFAAYFPKDPPARAVLGVARVPEAPLQITAVAVRDRK